MKSSLLRPWNSKNNFLLSTISRSKPKFLNSKFLFICQDQYQRHFRPFVILYMNILHVYTNISPAFILFIEVRPPTVPTFPSPSYQIFSPAALRKELILMIYHLTIISGFQLIRSGLENKRAEAIVFFPICTTKTMEGGACIVGGWTAIKRMKTRKTCLYMPFTSHTKFHTPHHHIYMRKRRETRKEVFPNMNQTWNKC